MKVAAAIQNVIQCYPGIYDEKKRATTQTSLDCSFKKVDRIESSKEPEPVPSTAGMESQLALCLLFLMPLQLYHLPPSPPPVSNSSCSLNTSPCCSVLLCFSRYCTFRLKMFYFFEKKKKNKGQFLGKIHCCTRLKESISENVRRLLKGPWTACLSVNVFR